MESDGHQDKVMEDRFLKENIQAEEAIAASKLDDGAQLLSAIIKDDPDNWRAYNNMGIIAWTKKNWDDAFVLFKKSVLLRGDYSDALINLFDAALKVRRIPEVLPLFEKALRSNPNLPEIKTIRDAIIEQGDGIYQSKRAYNIGAYSSLIEQANRELEAGNLNSAMDLYIKVNDSEGPNPTVFCGLGIISFYQKRFDDAFLLFTESIKLNPEELDTYLNLLDAAKACGKVKTAKEIFGHFRKTIPSLESIAQEFDKAEETAPAPKAQG